MPITEFLERNAKMWGDDTALVEINPENESNRQENWREYELIEGAPEE